MPPNTKFKVEKKNVPLEKVHNKEQNAILFLLSFHSDFVCLRSEDVGEHIEWSGAFSKLHTMGGGGGRIDPGSQNKVNARNTAVK